MSFTPRSISPPPVPVCSVWYQHLTSIPVPALTRTSTISPPKYKCPGCLIRYCSLPCFALHRKRTLCSGQRNPAQYIPRRELATEANFDKDFNFLSGLERNLESVSRNERVSTVMNTSFVRIAQVQGQPRSKPSPWLNPNVRKAVDESGIYVRRMPAGMSRARQNQTSWDTRSKQLRWTVEWVVVRGEEDEGGETKVFESKRTGFLFHTASIYDAWNASCETEAKRAQKQLRQTRPPREVDSQAERSERRPKRRKTGNEKNKPEVQDGETPALDDRQIAGDAPILESTNVTGEGRDELSKIDTSASVEEDAKDRIRPEQMEVKPIDELQPPNNDAVTTSEGGQLAEALPSEPEQPAPNTNRTPSTWRIFIHLPLAQPSHPSKKVLLSVPEHTSNSIKDVLQGKSIDEFPTIYCFERRADTPDEEVYGLENFDVRNA